MELQTVIDIKHSDISSELCTACAACCHVKVTVPNMPARTRVFFRQAGVKLSPDATPGQHDCCEKIHDVTFDLGPCQRLVTEERDGKTSHRCSIYGTPDMPQLCRDFDCVSWAKVNNTYNSSNTLLSAAQAALNALRQAAEKQDG